MITEKDWSTINKALTDVPTTEISMALLDLFALGCYLHAKGEKKAGIKAIKTALRATKQDWSKTDIFSGLAENIIDNERLFLDKVLPHNEILNLGKSI